MAPIPGYAGKILRVNLSTGNIVSQELDMEMAYNYLGGSGFGTKILWDEVGPDVEPFSADNRLIFAIRAGLGNLHKAISGVSA